MSRLNDPYPYQVQVAEHVLAGRSVILQAPTGAGKTAAALLPFIHARKNLPADAFPRKCIYSVPMKVLANQFEHEYRELIRGYGWKDDLRIHLHTGDRPEDRQFEGDLIFTTIDQTLSGFLNIPYGLGTRRANLNAGAVMSSYLVFDELHLYDPDTTLPTTLEMLKMLGGVAPFIVMTATFSTAMLQELADLLGAVVVPDPQEPAQRKNMEQIGSQVGKDRRFFTQLGALTADAVLATPFQRAICICNTVASAQRLFDELSQALRERDDNDTDLKLLHSRFYKADRRAKETWIHDHFGPAQADYDGRRLIQIATQVIEVGVDATCDVLHTELSPASSLLQRAGRCARREHERGKVFIYLPRDERGEPYYAPYGFGPRGRQLCETTWAAVNTASFSGVHMSFHNEQALIDAVHTPVDRDIMREMKHSAHTRRGDMLRTMRDQERGLARELIRDVDNRFVFVHPDPQNDERLLTNPWAYDGFGLYPAMLSGAYRGLLQVVGSETPWMMKGAHSITDNEAPARQRPEYTWYELEANEVFTAPVIVIHPDLVQYDHEHGFRFALSAGDHRSPLRDNTRTLERYSYRRETYAEHVAGLYAAYRHGGAQYIPLRDEIAYAVRQLENSATRFRLTGGQLDTILRAMFVCHDLGKLDRQWQAWAHAWQSQAGRYFRQNVTLPSNYMAAHTDFDPADADQRSAQRNVQPKRPNHAGESGMAAAALLDELCGDSDALWKAAITAIFRHHTATASSYTSYELHPAAGLAIEEALQVAGCPAEWSRSIPLAMNAGQPLAEVLVDFDNRNLAEVLLYFLLVRVLRLADQRSQAT